MYTNNTFMKTENNNSNNSIFRSLYYGQPVLQSYSYVTPIRLSGHWIESTSPYTWLSLRSISSLTDEEAQRLVSIAMYHPNIEGFDPKECGSGDGDYNLDGSFWLEASCRCWDGTLSSTPSFTFSLVDDNDKVEPVYNQTACTDYLRSIGILIPWMDLSVEDIINYGWAKVKEA